MAMALQSHARSISLPSRLHPGSLKLEERLNKLKILEDYPVSLSSVQARLLGLSDLYVSFNELIRSPSTQQHLRSYENGLLVEEAIDGSASFVNTSSVVRDMVSSLKDHVRDVQSSLRRRSCIQTHVADYVVFRKNSKKEIAKCIREIKQSEAKYNRFAPLLDADLHLAMVIRVLREIVSIAINIFKSLLVFLSLPVLKAKSSSTKWSLISRFRSSSRSGEEMVLNEVGCVDMDVLSMQSNRRNEGMDLERVQKRLGVLDTGIQSVEIALDSLFRCLVQNRVCLLNILTN